LQAQKPFHHVANTPTQCALAAQSDISPRSHERNAPFLYMQMAFMNARGVNHAARNSRARVPIGQKFSRSTVIYYARNAGLRGCLKI